MLKKGQTQKEKLCFYMVILFFFLPLRPKEDRKNNQKALYLFWLDWTVDFYHR